MDRSLGLTPMELERLLLVIDASLKISRRHHFYLWVQGIVQSLLPHDLLVCVAVDHDRRRVAVDHFSNVPLPDADAVRLCDSSNGLGIGLMQAWLRHGAQPMLIDTANPGNAVANALARGLAGLGLGFAAVHGTLAPGGSAASAFVLLRSEGPRGGQLRYLLDILVPYLHVSWIRSQVNDSAATPGDAPGGARPLTGREAEILHWVQQGESNADIAARLHISALTVKNHVQNILRKLKVQNRAQAAARGIIWGITKPPS